MIFQKSCLFFGFHSEKVADFLEVGSGIVNKNAGAEKFVV